MVKNEKYRKKNGKIQKEKASRLGCFFFFWGERWESGPKACALLFGSFYIDFAHASFDAPHRGGRFREHRKKEKKNANAFLFSFWGERWESNP